MRWAIAAMSCFSIFLSLGLSNLFLHCMKAIVWTRWEHLRNSDIAAILTFGFTITIAYINLLVYLSPTASYYILRFPKNLFQAFSITFSFAILVVNLFFSVLYIYPRILYITLIFMTKLKLVHIYQKKISLAFFYWCILSEQFLKVRVYLNLFLSISFIPFFFSKFLFIIIETFWQM